ncbi:MAG: CRISPR-associated helicase Cas3' [Clostridia bacterium]|nr:CRISPR-associated helicase Cas3' [Clostridia bacterium]
MHTAHIVIDPQTKVCRLQTCTEHSHSVADLAKGILTPCGLGSTGYLAGLLHDCGKFTNEFDAYIRKASSGERLRKGSVIHTFAGVRCIMELFHSSSERSVKNMVAEAIAICIGSHHGLFDLWDERHQSGFEHRLKHQPEYDRRAISAFYEECAAPKEIEKLFADAEQEILDCLQYKLTACVRSHKEFCYALGLLVRLITSAVVDADRTDTRCFMQNVPIPQADEINWTDCAAQVNAYIAALRQDTPIQTARRAFSDRCAAAAENEPGLYRLDLPTGGGKTLAALRFAVLHAEKNNLRRILYVAPFLSVIEQNADVIRSAVGDSIPVLEHHSNLVQEDTAPEEASQTEYLQETWDVPMIITTFVQLLNTLFSGKMSSVRRFHALCESVIIIDEVQSLPPRMLSMFNCAVNFLVKCCRTTVVLCSATQPAFDKAERKMLPYGQLISDDMFRQYAPLFKRTIIQDAGACSMQEIADLSIETLETSDSLLVVCNTKREAADLFHTLGEATEAKLFHLSAGMCMAHREQVLREMNEALARKEKLICASTQLIEAGVDISFGSVIRLSAGLDSIVQSAGRCNRHGEHNEPQPVRICRLKSEKLGSLKEISAAQDALNVLLEEYRLHPERYDHDLASDAAVRNYYTAVYSNMPKRAQDFYVNGQYLFELLSTNTQFLSNASSSYMLNQAFRTAGEWFEVFDSNSEGILVPYCEGRRIIDDLADDDLRYDLSRTATLLEKAKPYTVSVTTRQIEQMQKNGMLYTLLDGSIYVLNDHYFDDDIGIREENDLCSTLIL